MFSRNEFSMEESTKRSSRYSIESSISTSAPGSLQYVDMPLQASSSPSGFSPKKRNAILKRNLLRDKAVEGLHEQDFENVINCALESLDITMELHKNDAKAGLAEFILLTRAYFNLGIEAEGMYYLNQAAKLCHLQPYDDPASNAALYSVLAELYLMRNDAKTAEIMYKEYCRHMEEIFGDKHIATSDCYNVISAFYTHQGQYAKALQYCGKALIIRVEQLGVDHRFTADNHYNLGLLYRLSGKLDEAIREFRIARDIRSRVYSEFALEVAEVDLSMGFTYHQKSELDDAHRCLLSAYEVRSRLLGEKHDDTIEARNLLNAIRASKGLKKVNAADTKRKYLLSRTLPKGPSRRVFVNENEQFSVLDLFFLRRKMNEMAKGVHLREPFHLPRELRKSIEEAARLGPLTLKKLSQMFGQLYPYHVSCLIKYIKSSGEGANLEIEVPIAGSQRSPESPISKETVDESKNGFTDEQGSGIPYSNPLQTMEYLQTKPTWALSIEETEARLRRSVPPTSIIGEDAQEFGVHKGNTYTTSAKNVETEIQITTAGQTFLYERVNRLLQESNDPNEQDLRQHISLALENYKSDMAQSELSSINEATDPVPFNPGFDEESINSGNQPSLYQRLASIISQKKESALLEELTKVLVESENQFNLRGKISKALEDCGDDNEQLYSRIRELLKENSVKETELEKRVLKILSLHSEKQQALTTGKVTENIKEARSISYNSKQNFSSFKDQILSIVQSDNNSEDELRSDLVKLLSEHSVLTSRKMQMQDPSLGESPFHDPFSSQPSSLLEGVENTLQDFEEKQLKNIKFLQNRSEERLKHDIMEIVSDYSKDSRTIKSDTCAAIQLHEEGLQRNEAASFSSFHNEMNEVHKRQLEPKILEAVIKSEERSLFTEVSTGLSHLSGDNSHTHGNELSEDENKTSRQSFRSAITNVLAEANADDSILSVSETVARQTNRINQFARGLRVNEVSRLRKYAEDDVALLHHGKRQRQKNQSSTSSKAESEPLRGRQHMRSSVHSQRSKKTGVEGLQSAINAFPTEGRLAVEIGHLLVKSKKDKSQFRTQVAEALEKASDESLTSDLENVLEKYVDHSKSDCSKPSLMRRKSALSTENMEEDRTKDDETAFFSAISKTCDDASEDLRNSLRKLIQDNTLSDKEFREKVTKVLNKTLENEEKIKDDLMSLLEVHSVNQSTDEKITGKAEATQNVHLSGSSLFQDILKCLSDGENDLEMTKSDIAKALDRHAEYGLRENLTGLLKKIQKDGKRTSFVSEISDMSSSVSYQNKSLEESIAAIVNDSDIRRLRDSAHVRIHQHKQHSQDALTKLKKIMETTKEGVNFQIVADIINMAQKEESRIIEDAFTLLSQKLDAGDGSKMNTTTFAEAEEIMAEAFKALNHIHTELFHLEDALRNSEKGDSETSQRLSEIYSSLIRNSNLSTISTKGTGFPAVRAQDQSYENNTLPGENLHNESKKSIHTKEVASSRADTTTNASVHTTQLNSDSMPTAVTQQVSSISDIDNSGGLQRKVVEQQHSLELPRDENIGLVDKCTRNTPSSEGEHHKKFWRLDGKALLRSYKERLFVAGLIPFLSAKHEAEVLEPKAKRPARASLLEEIRSSKDLALKPKQTKLKAQSETKQLHWDVLKNTEGTIWETVNSAFDDIGESFSDLKSSFSSKNVDVAESANNNRLPKNKEIALIADSKRRQNMSIFVKTLTKGGRRLEDVVIALKKLEIDKFDSLSVVSYEKFLPNEQEINALKKYDGNIGLLGPAESYIWHIKSIPSLRTRIQCIKFMLNCRELIETVRKSCKVLEETSRDIRQSKKLSRLLGIILKVGNQLNEGSSKAGAQGVKISSLMKLTTTKTNKKVTLLEYIVVKMKERDPEILVLREELPQLEQSSKINLSKLRERFASIENGLRTLDIALKDAHEKNDSYLIQAVSPVFSEASGDFNIIQESMDEMNTGFEELCVYLGENPKSSNPHNLLIELQKFVSVLEATVKKIHEAEERKARRLRKNEK